MSEVKEIKKSENKVQIVGEMSELNLKDEVKDTTIRKNGKEVKVKCGVIEKADYKSGASMTIKVEPKDEDGNVRYSETVGINFYPIKEKKLDENGNVVDNSFYKSMQTIMNYEKGTRVRVDGSLIANEYASSKDGKNYDYHSIPQVNAFIVSSTAVPENDMAEGYITGVIRQIVPETRGEEATETGRLKVELFYFDNKGATTPNTFIVTKEFAEPFTDLYENGQSVQLNYEIVSHQTNGGAKKSKAAFGRESNVTSGYTVTEYQIVGGDAPFEEENEHYVSMQQMKDAMTARQNLIDTTIDNKKKEDAENAGGKTAKKGLGRPSNVSKSATDDQEELPF